MIKTTRHHSGQIETPERWSDRWIGDSLVTSSFTRHASQNRIRTLGNTGTRWALIHVQKMWCCHWTGIGNTDQIGRRWEVVSSGERIMIIPGKLFNTTKVKHDCLINRSSVGWWCPRRGWWSGNCKKWWLIVILNLSILTCTDEATRGLSSPSLLFVGVWWPAGMYGSRAERPSLYDKFSHD